MKNIKMRKEKKFKKKGRWITLTSQLPGRFFILLHRIRHNRRAAGQPRRPWRAVAATQHRMKTHTRQRREELLLRWRANKFVCRRLTKEVSKLQPLLSVVFPYPQRIHTHTQHTHNWELHILLFFYYFLFFFLYFFGGPAFRRRVLPKKKRWRYTGKGTTIDPMIFNRS